MAGCCYTYLLKDSHLCVDRAMHQNCPVCFEVNICHSKLSQKIGFSKVTIFTTLETALINHSLINVRFCHSIYSSRRKLSACFIVDTRFICNACTRWELTSSKPPMSTPDRYLADAFPDRGHSQLIRRQPADFFRFSCPVCLRSSCDMSGMWQKLDQEVQLPPLPIMVFVLY